MRRTPIVCLIALVLVAADEKPRSGRVEVIGVSQRRSTGNVEAIPEKWGDERLVVVLRIAGLDQPAKGGKVVIQEATDDVGTNLIPLDASSSGELAELPSATKRRSGNTYETLPEIDVPVNLRPADAKARRIAHLKGVINVRAGGGKQNVGVRVPGVKSLLGKTVESPELARAGVTVQVSNQDELEPTGLAVLISGKLPRDVNVLIVDAQGELVSTGGGGSGSKTTWCSTIDLKRPLEPTDVLVVHLPMGQQPVSVPFDLKDIALP